MLKHRIYITLGFIAFAAFNLAAPGLAQTQSTCSPDQHKQLILTVVDKDGNAIDKLRVEDLSLKVGSSPATIADVVFRNGPAMDIAVLIDVSASQETVIPTSKTAARALIKSVAKVGLDRVAIVSFAEKPNYLQVLTTDVAAAAAAIEQIKFEPPPGYVGRGVVITTNPSQKPGLVTGATSLWDAVRTATEDLFDAADKNRRRVVLLFSDGMDTSSSSKLNRATDEAIKRDAAVFAIGVADSSTFSLDEEPLKKLSEQTGGIARFPGKKQEKLEAALTEMLRHLRGNYVIGYCGGEAKERAKLQLDIVDPEMRKVKPVLAYKRY